MKAGRTIRNEKTGETLTMIVSEEDNGGARQLYEVRLPAHRPSPPRHYHLRFIETFKVLAGTLDLYVGLEQKHVVLRPQESLKVEIKQVHTFANESEQPALISIETIPAGGVVKAFQLGYGVANEGGARPDGLPKSALVRLLFVRLTEGFLPGIPVVVQKMAFAVAGFVARVTGLQRRVEKYFR